MRRSGRFRIVLTSWLEQIAALVDLPDVVNQAKNPDAILQERLSIPQGCIQPAC